MELNNFNISFFLVFLFVLMIINLIIYYVFRKNELLSTSYAQKKIEIEMLKYREEYYKKLEEYNEQMLAIKDEHKDQLLKILPLIEDNNIKRELDIVLKNYQDGAM